MYDVIVVGLGAMGSSTLSAVSRAGARAIGLEQFERVPDRGGSVGRSRMIRKAYFEDPAYVPLVLSAYEGWSALEKRTSSHLFEKTGALIVGDPATSIIPCAHKSAVAHGIPHEVLSNEDVRRRYPQIAIRDGEGGLFEPDAGFIFPERAIDAFLRDAESAGAEARYETRVTGWSSTEAGSLQVTLADGSLLETARLAVCTGSWMAQILAELGVPIVVQRNVQLWFEPSSDGYDVGRFPAFFADRPDLPKRLYGFPNHGFGLKAAFHIYGETTDPDGMDREIRDSDVEPVRQALGEFLPGAAGRFLGGKVCMYDLTPDENFVISLHPADSRICIAGGFSGHGFKFAPVVGEIVAGLLLDGGSRHEIGFLSPSRFGGVHR